MYHLTKSSFTFGLLFIIVNNNGKKIQFHASFIHTNICAQFYRLFISYFKRKSPT